MTLGNLRDSIPQLETFGSLSKKFEVKIVRFAAGYYKAAICIGFVAGG